MPLIQPYIDKPEERHRSSAWVRDECYRFYARERRRHCTHLERLDLWLRAPVCVDCAVSEPSLRERMPDVAAGDGWQDDLAWHVADETASQIIANATTDPAFALVCKRCREDIRPWLGDDVVVLTHHLEEHYGILLETPERQQPSKWLQARIQALYGNVCFGCGSRAQLHIDHILPRALGGDAAFRNLQPLCQTCGNAKAAKAPLEVTVFNDIYFTSPPSDSYEGLFW